MSSSIDFRDRPPRDDLVLPFRTETSGISGRIVRLSATTDEILTRHAYPTQVAEVMGEALALTALLGSQLKFDGRLIVQTRSDGPLGFFVTNYRTPGQLRGYASFDRSLDAEQLAAFDHGALLGSGHLALTIDQGPEMDLYQGIVPLEGTALSDAAQVYFRRSEQLPTYIRLAVARHRSLRDTGDDAWHWRAGGIMVQHVSPEGGKPPPEDAPDDFLLGDDDDAWLRVSALARTVEDHELIDPTLSAERLLYRLFHEEGVRVFHDHPIGTYCQCSRDRIGSFLKSFSAEDLESMRDAEGRVTVTCEFCARSYPFADGDVL
ncbi:MAG: Hsp33 family molecular chaperone [Hyphomicrobiaceae bacterium]